ncbi:hypothetical protein J7J45_05435 [Candidatus Aerophobetes bacterium]|nr:hypothetical protein [Candidatus Aerophobetes bacterium]
MRVMVIYSSQSKKFDSLAEVMSATLQSKGHQVEKIKVERAGRIPSLFAYDLVFVGSPVEGFWGGKFSEELSNFIGKCVGFEGKKSAVFVYPKTFGTGKAMKRIMRRLEEKGSIVIDFRSIKNKSEARAFAEKLGRKRTR